MKSLKRKLILGLFTLGLLFTCLTTTTYAWFARNSEAWTNDMELELENYDGLQISIDGINFRSNIPNSELKKAIVSKASNIPVEQLNDEKTDEFFERLNITGVTTANLKDFKTVDSNVKNDDGSFKLVNASEYSYYSFDLYFRLQTARATDQEYDLTFVSNDYANRATSNVGVSSFKEAPTKATIYSGFSIGDKKIEAGSKIDIDLRNAVRIGVLHDESLSDLDENDKGFTIYEPYIGLGSYAIEGETEDKYNPAMNYMLNHLDAYSGHLNPISKDDGDVYKMTEKDFNSEISFGRFVPTEDNKYKDVKITIYIWLEGYDSDYLSTVDDLGLSFKLSFRKKEVIKHE